MSIEVGGLQPASSTQTFTVAYPQITLTSPRAGASWYYGVSYPIVWNYILPNPDMKVNLYVKTSNGTTVRTLVSGMTAPGENTQGQYDWVVPRDILRGQYYLYIECGGHGGASVHDQTGLFTIGPKPLASGRPGIGPSLKPEGVIPLKPPS